MSMYHRLLDWAGIGDINRRHREWRRQQIQLEIEEAQLECAQLAAYIGHLQKEKQELEMEIQSER